MRTLFWIALVFAVAWWLLTCDCGGECRRHRKGAENSPIARAPTGNKVYGYATRGECGGGSL